MTRYKILYTLKHYKILYSHGFFLIADVSGSQLWGLSFAKVLTDLFKKLYPPLVIDEEELHGIETDDILNLENLSGAVFID